MLCFYCMDKKDAVSLLDVVAEAQNLIAQQEAMKKSWEQIDKGDKKWSRGEARKIQTGLELYQAQ